MGMTDLVTKGFTHRFAKETLSAWANATEYLPIDELVEAIGEDLLTAEGPGDNEVVLDGVEAVTDEVLYVLTQSVKALTKVSCVGCIHLTDYGVKLIAESFHGLKEIILDGCWQITPASLIYLSQNCPDLVSVSVRGTAVTHLPEALTENFKQAFKDDALCGCPLIDGRNQDKSDPEYLKKYKLVILAKDEVPTSVLHYLENNDFTGGAPPAHRATYHPDVTFKDVKGFTFNVIEAHLPRTIYPLLISPRAVYVFAMDFSLMESPLIHYMSLLNSLGGQVLNVTVQVLCLHTGTPFQLEALESLVEEAPRCENQQAYTLDAQLEDESYQKHGEHKADRNFSVQVQHMRAREHRSRQLKTNIFSVNTATNELELIWPKRNTKDNSDKDDREGGDDQDDEEDVLGEFDTGYSVQDLRNEYEALREKAEALYDEGASCLEGAQQAVGTINKKDISELKSFSKPPQLAKRCVGHITMLLGFKVTDPNEDDWKLLKRHVGDSSFYEKMKNLDKDNIPAKVTNALGVYLADPDSDTDKLRNISSACHSFGIYMRAVYEYTQKVVDPLKVMKKKLEDLEKQMKEAENGQRPVARTPRLIRALLTKDLRAFHAHSVPHLHLPRSPAVTAVYTAVGTARTARVVPLQRLVEGVEGGLTAAVVKRVLQHMHDVGDALFFPDSPDQVVVTDIPWFLEVLSLIHSLETNVKFHNQARVRFLGPGAAIYTQSEFMAVHPDVTAEQVSLLFGLLEEMGVLIRIPPAYLPSAPSSEPYYFSFADVDEKPFIREGSTGGKHSTSRLTQNFWSDDVDPGTTLVLEQYYRLTLGLPLPLLPRLVAECLQLGAVLAVYRWGVLVRHGAAEIRVTHNIQMAMKSSSIDLELRTFSADPPEVLYDYMWSIFSNYLLVAEHQLHRFPQLAVKVRQPCRGSCAQTRFPHMYTPWEIPRQLGYRAPCPKCGADNMAPSQTHILTGRRHMLPFHNMVDGIDTTEATNPACPYNNLHPAPQTGSQGRWRCFVCNTRQAASLRLWSYEASISPAFAVSCLNIQTGEDTDTPTISRQGNILSLNEGVQCGVATLREAFVITGITSLSLMPLSAGKITLGLGREAKLEQCFKQQSFDDVFDIFELHSGKLENRHRDTSEALESFSPLDVLSIHVVRQRFVRQRSARRTKEILELQFQKNGSEFARREFGFPLSVAIMLEKDDSSDSPQVLVGCPTYAVIHADYFPLKGALFYKNAASDHWNLAQVIATKRGKLVIANSPTDEETVELPPDSDRLLPMCFCSRLAAATMLLGKEVMRHLNEYVPWSEKHGAWPAPPCLFQTFRTSKNKSDFSAAKLGSFEYDSWACSASRHSPEVLHVSAIKAMNYRGGNQRRLDRSFVLLPTDLSPMKLSNPYRSIAHDFTAQSLHLICPGKELGLQGVGAYSGISDAHFIGAPSRPLEESEVKWLLVYYKDALTYSYVCLLTLKNVFLPIEGCDDVSVEEIQLNLLEYMQTYLSTTTLIAWLQLFKPHAGTWIKKDNMSKGGKRATANKTIQELHNMSNFLGKDVMTGPRRAKKETHVACRSHVAVSQHTLEKADEESSKYLHFVRSLSMFKGLKTANQLDPYMQALTNLVKLDLRSCLLDALPGIDQCHHIASLNLLENRFTAIPEELRSLQGTLQELDMRDNPVTALPDFFSGFTLLTKLSLSYVRELPEDFGNLQRLVNLVLEHTTLTELPHSFRKLNQLEYLRISGIPWPSIKGKGEYIMKGNWMSLFEKLEASSALGITEETWEELFDEHDIDNDGQLAAADELPKFLQKIVNFFPRLGHKEVDGEKGRIPQEIFACRRLRMLTLHFTAITAVPEDIQYLPKIFTLELGDNPLLENISTEVGKIRKLKALGVSGCPNLRTPPPEIVSQGNAALIGYLRRLSQGSVACFSTKLMFVGLGGAGKTSLMRALMSVDGKCPETRGEAITDGIDITSWSVPHQGETLTFSVWDFAGQTVYYNTHQFFLSKRAVYILVWNTRLGYEHSGLNFWLASIACHTPKAPIFVVGTHADKISKSEIPMQKLKERFPNIAGFMRVSSHTGEGVLPLLNKLAEVTFEQPYIGERIPEAWLSFEKLILGQRYRESMMTWDETCTLAQKAAISGPEVRRAVLFLHERGTLQYFDNELLRDRVIINPQWIVDVMACVVSVHDSPIVDGQLLHEDIQKIWKEYPSDLHEWLLGLTEVFDLTFPLPDKPVNIVPCLLPKEEPEIAWPLQSDDMIEMKMVYTFDYLPAGLFNRAQVRLYQFSESTSMWKEGSVLKKNNHMALVKQTKETVVMVKVIGVRPENILLLVHEVFEGLITEFFQGVKYEYHLPCMDCIRMDSKEQAMFSSRIMYRAVQSRALFLQCHLHFHTLSISSVQQVLMPSSSADYDLQLDSAIRGLDDLHHDLEHDVFFMYCAKDVPDDVMDSKRCHPKRVMLDLKEAGLKCLYEDDLENKKVTDIIISMRKCKMFLIFISNDFVEDPHCQRLFQFMLTNQDAQFLLLMVGKGREWRESNLGMKVSEKVYINFQRMNQYEDRLRDLMEKVNQKLGKSQDGDFTVPEVFLSYCWSNSATSIADGIARPKDGSVGAGDPRQMKQFLEDEGFKVWLDIEQTGKAGLFEDISAGMKKAKVVVACVSDEYVQSPNCQMEFRFAHIALRMPMVIAVVGTGFQWEATEIGMLSLGYPKVNFIVANNLSHQSLLELVKERVNAATSEEKVERPMSSVNTSQKEMAFQELYELAQRKFLRQISSYVEQTDNYPRLFVVDLNYNPDATDQQGEADVDELVLDVSDNGPETAPRQSVEDMEAGMFCIKTLCEYEGGWHAVTDGVSVEVGGTRLMKLWQRSAPYMARILAILKHSDVNLHIIQHPEGSRIHGLLEQRASVQPQADLKPLYQLIREYVINKDQNMGCGGLARCHMPSGKVLWLCEEHRAGPRITELPSDEDNAYLGYTGKESPESILLAGLSKMQGAVLMDEEEKEASGATTYRVRPTSARPTSARPLTPRSKSNLTKPPQQPPPQDKGDGKPPSSKKDTVRPTGKKQATSDKGATGDKKVKTEVTKQTSDVSVRSVKSGRLSSKDRAERRERKDQCGGSASQDGVKVPQGSARSTRQSSGTTQGRGRPATMEEKANIAAKVSANVNVVNGSQACIIL